MPAKALDASDAIIQRLHALVQQMPDLKDAAGVYEAILPLLRDADLHVAPVSIAPDLIHEKLNAGLPLLHGLDLEMDVEALRELMLKLAAALETNTRKNRPHTLRLPWMQALNKPVTAASRVRLALEKNRLDISTLLPHIAAGERGPILSAAQGLGLDPDLVWTIAQNALKPALRAWCRQLTPMVTGIPWLKGNCFVCGAFATLAELRENNQEKHLRCGVCGADWLFQRLQCVYCGNEDHATQSYLYSDGLQKNTRVELCGQCKGYLKVISAFAPTAPEILIVEDLATLHLDYVAEARGYTRGAVHDHVSNRHP